MFFKHKYNMWDIEYLQLHSHWYITTSSNI